MQKKEVAPILPSKDMVLGNAAAPVHVVMFGDYESQETRQLNGMVLQSMQAFEGQVKFTYRHFPLTRIHQRAHKASEAVIAAGQEGKYWEMHQQVMDHPNALGIISLKSLAREAGVTNKRFLEQLMNGMYGWNVQDDLREGLSLGIRDVPALFINGHPVSQPFTARRLNKLIREELKAVEHRSSRQGKAA